MVARSWSGNDDAAIDDSLNAIERGLVHERLEVATCGHTVIRALDLGDVDRVPHHLSEALRREHQSTSRAQTGFRDSGDNLLLRKPSGRQFLERASDEGRPFRVEHQAHSGRFRRVQISEGRRERPAAKFERRAHAGARAVRAHVVIELREGSQDTFHQLSCGGVVDRLGGRPQRDAERPQVRAEREMVVLLPRESRDVVRRRRSGPCPCWCGST